MDNVRHHKDTAARIIYTIINFLFFAAILEKSKISLNVPAAIIFLLLITGEYLLDNLDFKNYKKISSSFATSLFINLILFLIYWSFTKNFSLFSDVIIFTLFQTLVKKVLTDFFIKKQKVLLVGKGKELKEIKEILLKEYRSIDFKITEELLDIEQKVFESEINRIILFQLPKEKEIIDELIKLKTQGIKITEYMDFMEKYKGKIALKEINDFWLLKSSGFSFFYSSFYKKIKRIFDIFAALIITAASSPLMLLAYIVTKLEMPGVSPIYSQERIGFRGKPFKIYKFRSMRPHSPELSLEEKAKYVTRFGNFMRRTRIDELPQLWNVLKGEISFVGPRAEWERLHLEYAENIPYYYLRQTVKPGLTGWAQVMHTHGEGIEHSQEKFEYDLYYIKYQNFILDMMIFLKTIKIVLFGRGK